MSHIDNEWRSCNFTGTIKKYEIEPKVIEEYENIDDYDVRNGFGSRVTITRSRFDREEF